MKLKLFVVGLVVASMNLVWAGPALANCSGDSVVATLYRKVTGNELIHCP